MQCPKCGTNMNKGVVFVQKSSGIHWVPNKESIPHTISKKKILACGGEVIIPIVYLGADPPSAPAWICKSCKITCVEYL